MKALNKQWKELNEKAKEKLKAEYDSAMTKYNKDLEEWRKKYNIKDEEPKREPKVERRSKDKKGDKTKGAEKAGKKAEKSAEKEKGKSKDEKKKETSKGKGKKWRNHLIYDHIHKFFIWIK